MKKKILVSFLAICLCVISLFGLTACSNPLSMPNSLDVTSNGGAMVRVGEYVYFVNGYVNTSNLKYGDNRKNVTQGAIYRVKLGTNNSLSYDESGNMKGAEKVVDNIGGFSSLNLYVYDNYLYYTTPLSTPDKQGNSQFGRTVIKQVKLNGEDNRELYTTSSSSPISWAVYKIDGNVVVGVLDGENLVSINVTTGKTNTVAKDVSSVAFPSVTEYRVGSESATKGEQQVYYTRTDDSINGNAIYKANLKTLQGNSSPVINANNGSEYSLVSYKTDGLSGKIYYTKTYQGSTYYYGTTVNENGEVLSTTGTTQYTTLTYSDIDFTFEPYDRAIAVYEYKDGDATKKQLQFVLGSTTSVISDTEITILAVRDDFLYGYNTNNQLVKIDLRDEEHKATVIAKFENEKDDEDKEIEDGKDAFYSTGIATDKLNKNLFVDFDGDYMYFFRNFKNNNGNESVYLARVNYKTSSEEHPAEVEIVGQMEESHKYKVS